MELQISLLAVIRQFRHSTGKKQIIFKSILVKKIYIHTVYIKVAYILISE